MSFKYLILLSCLAAALSSCKTSSPDSGGAAATEAAAPAPETDAFKPSGKTVPLESAAFSVIANTNQLDPQWLRPPTDFFRLGPGDSFEIEILGEAASRSRALVGPDGKVYFNLLPGTFVWGMTLSEAKAAIDDGLQKFFRDKPKTALILRSVGSRRVWILGSVQNPGVYGLGTPLTLLDALTFAGGPSTAPLSTQESADLQNSFVMRDGRLLPVDFYRLLRRGDLTQNVYLQPDDFIYLRPSVGQNVYVLGAVSRPNVLGYAPDMTLLSAIANAGGAIEYSKVYEVAIVRGTLTNPRLAAVNYRAIYTGKEPDVRLEPGDIVYVPYAPYRRLALLGQSILNQFVSTIALNEGRNAVLRESTPIGISVGFGGP